jgi:hypothetical protein
MNDERKGYQLFIFSAFQGDAIIAEAERGNKDAANMAQVVVRFIDMLSALEPGRGPCCMMCDDVHFDKTSRVPVAFAVLYPMFPDADGSVEALTSPICLNCYRDAGAAFGAEVFTRLQELMPDLAIMPVQ